MTGFELFLSALNACDPNFTERALGNESLRFVFGVLCLVVDPQHRLHDGIGESDLVIGLAAHVGMQLCRNVGFQRRLFVDLILFFLQRCLKRR